MSNNAISVEELGIRPVDPNSPIPLYYQIYTDLKAIITSGRLKPGDMLPPELILCVSYGVGRQTIRGAILRLVDENLLDRFAGRGTFVRAPKNRLKFYLDRSFAQQMIEMGMKPRSRVLELKSGVIDAAAPKALHGKMGSKCLRLVRLRYGDDTPIGVQYTTIITDLCPGLEQYDFNQESLYIILSTQYDLPIACINQVVRAVLADEVHRNLLQSYANAPLLYVETTAFLESGEPIETTNGYYRADKYEYSIRQAFQEKKNG